MLRSSASLAASPNSSSAWPGSSAAFQAAAQGIAAALQSGAQNEAEPFPSALLREVLRQDRALLAGIAAYRRHPWRRTLIDPPAVWTEGATRMLDYAPASAPGAPTVLFVPSLVNRAYVLDLQPGHSMMRFLAAEGIRPLLLDWGWPGPAERDFGLTDYVAGRMERAMTAARDLAGGPAVLAGYCMGGTLAVAAAQRRPDLVRALALLAAPWDFHAEDQDRAEWTGRMLPVLEPALAFAGTLPVDLLQMLFSLLDPFGVTAKYRAFARVRPDSDRARLFVALEDWLNDGVPLAAPVARETLGGWYAHNTPGTGTWRIAGLPVDPSALRMPAFVAIPARDRIVPPGSARALADQIPWALVHTPQAGHIGMAAGSGAEANLWRPLMAWLRSAPLSAPPPRV
jgi:poly(3-hydroxyalkanoate) synthetase